MGLALWVAHLSALWSYASTPLTVSSLLIELLVLSGLIAFAAASWMLFDEDQKRPQRPAAAAVLGGSVVGLHALTLVFSTQTTNVVQSAYGVAVGMMLCIVVWACAFWVNAEQHATLSDRLTQRTGAAIFATLATAFALHIAGYSRQPYSPTTADLAVTGRLTWQIGVLGGSTLAMFALRALLRRQLRMLLEQSRQSRKAEQHRMSDPLTGLPTRTRFEGTLTQAAHKAEATGEGLSVHVLGIDGLKIINEAQGYPVGDSVICTVAERLRKLCKPHCVARLAGDRFVVLQPAAGDAVNTSEFALVLLGALANTIETDGGPLTVTVSIGIAMFPEHGAASALIAHAEAAMGFAKDAGGANHAYFDPRLVNQSRATAEMLRDLRGALAKCQLELYFQPKLHGVSGEITGTEALIRWNHPQRGTVSPAVFIPLAERYGLINEIGNFVIDQACRQARDWRDGGLRMRVAINLSVHQLRDDQLCTRIAEALGKYKINPELLTLEITESAAMVDTEATVRILHKFQALGVHISLDDFGTGHSSLAYLRKLPVHELKIDRTFVQDLETEEEARAVTRAVVGLAKLLSLKVVAEGVETDGQYRILREFGVDQLQGFLFGKPMTASALGQWALHSVRPSTLSATSLGFRESLFKDTQPAPWVEERSTTQPDNRAITA